MSKEETIELYYPLVTEAIRRAETLEDLDAPGAASAYMDVSLLEEKIAEALPPSDPEGALARRGAVRAAISAKEPKRARQLVERFLAEDDIGTELHEELEQFSQQAAEGKEKEALTYLERSIIKRIRQNLRDNVAKYTEAKEVAATVEALLEFQSEYVRSLRKNLAEVEGHQARSLIRRARDVEIAQHRLQQQIQFLNEVLQGSSKGQHKPVHSSRRRSS